MKPALLFLIFFTCAWHIRISAQSTVTTNTLHCVDETSRSNGLLSELQEIGCLPQPPKSQKNPFVYLNILVRKSGFPGGNTLYKDVFFDGQTSYHYTSGYIDESEIDDAIRVLKYINDSLLPLKPADKLIYEKSFTHSDLRVYAVFNPFTEDQLASYGLATLGKWVVYIDLDNTGYQDFVVLSPNDVSGVIGFLEIAKEKLKTF